MRVGIYLTDLGNFAAVNAVMADYFSQPYPARSTIGVAALPSGAEFEVDAVMVLRLIRSCTGDAVAQAARAALG